MAVFTSRVSERRSLEQLLTEALHLEQDGRSQGGRRPSEGLARARLALGDPSAFSAEVLRNYRRRDRLPDGLVQGAALALFGDSALTTFQPEELDRSEPAVAGMQLREAIEIEYALTAALVGLQFEAIHYECTLHPGPGDALDATTVTEYRQPRVSKRFGTLAFHSSSQTVMHGDDEVDAKRLLQADACKVEVTGRGVTYCGIKVVMRTEKQLGRVVRPGGELVGPTSSQRICEFVNDFTVGPDTDADTSIRITRHWPHAFSLVPKGPTHVEYAAQKVVRPTRLLTLTLNLPDGFFHDTKSAVVDAVAWLPWSLDMEQFNNRISRHIVGSQPKPAGPTTWVWQSEGPALMGMAYGLTYDMKQTAYFHDHAGNKERARAPRKRKRGKG